MILLQRMSDSLLIICPIGLMRLFEDIIVLDNYTIIFKTFEPYPGLLERLAHGGTIYCKNITEQPREQGLIGTGPYRIADYEIGNYTTLEWFNEYWGRTGSENRCVSSDRR